MNEEKPAKKLPAAQYSGDDMGHIQHRKVVDGRLQLHPVFQMENMPLDVGAYMDTPAKIVSSLSDVIPTPPCVIKTRQATQLNTGACTANATPHDRDACIRHRQRDGTRDRSSAHAGGAHPRASESPQAGGIYVSALPQFILNSSLHYFQCWSSLLTPTSLRPTRCSSRLSPATPEEVFALFNTHYSSGSATRPQLALHAAKDLHLLLFPGVADLVPTFLPYTYGVVRTGLHQMDKGIFPEGNEESCLCHITYIVLPKLCNFLQIPRSQSVCVAEPTSEPQDGKVQMAHPDCLLQVEGKIKLADNINLTTTHAEGALLVHWKRSGNIASQHTAPPHNVEESVRLQQLQNSNWTPAGGVFNHPDQIRITSSSRSNVHPDLALNPNVLCLQDDQTRPYDSHWVQTVMVDHFGQGAPPATPAVQERNESSRAGEATLEEVFALFNTHYASGSATQYGRATTTINSIHEVTSQPAQPIHSIHRAELLPVGVIWYNSGWLGHGWLYTQLRIFIPCSSVMRQTKYLLLCHTPIDYPPTGEALPPSPFTHSISEILQDRRRELHQVVIDLCQELHVPDRSIANPWFQSSRTSSPPLAPISTASRSTTSAQRLDMSSSDPNSNSGHVRCYPGPGQTTCLPPRQIGFDSQWDHSQIFASGDCAGRCCWLAGFLDDFLFPPILNSGAAPHSPRFTLSDSQDLDYIATDQLIFSSYSSFPIPCILLLLHLCLISPLPHFILGSFHPHLISSLPHFTLTGETLTKPLNSQLLVLKEIRYQIFFLSLVISVCFNSRETTADVDLAVSELPSSVAIMVKSLHFFQLMVGSNKVDATVAHECRLGMDSALLGQGCPSRGLRVTSLGFEPGTFNANWNLKLAISVSGLCFDHGGGRRPTRCQFPTPYRCSALRSLADCIRWLLNSGRRWRRWSGAEEIFKVVGRTAHPGLSQVRTLCNLSSGWNMQGIYVAVVSFNGAQVRLHCRLSGQHIPLSQRGGAERYYDRKIPRVDRSCVPPVEAEDVPNFGSSAPEGCLRSDGCTHRGMSATLAGPSGGIGIRRPLELEVAKEVVTHWLLAGSPELLAVVDRQGPSGGRWLMIHMKSSSTDVALISFDTSLPCHALVDSVMLQGTVLLSTSVGNIPCSPGEVGDLIEIAILGRSNGVDAVASTALLDKPKHFLTTKGDAYKLCRSEATEGAICWVVFFRNMMPPIDGDSYMFANIGFPHFLSAYLRATAVEGPCIFAYFNRQEKSSSLNSLSVAPWSCKGWVCPLKLGKMALGSSYFVNGWEAPYTSCVSTIAVDSITTALLGFLENEGNAVIVELVLPLKLLSELHKGLVSEVLSVCRDHPPLCLEWGILFDVKDGQQDLSPSVVQKTSGLPVLPHSQLPLSASAAARSRASVAGFGLLVLMRYWSASSVERQGTKSDSVTTVLRFGGCALGSIPGRRTTCVGCWTCVNSEWCEFELGLVLFTYVDGEHRVCYLLKADGCFKEVLSGNFWHRWSLGDAMLGPFMLMPRGRVWHEDKITLSHTPKGEQMTCCPVWVYNQVQCSPTEYGIPIPVLFFPPQGTLPLAEENEHRADKMMSRGGVHSVGSSTVPYTEVHKRVTIQKSCGYSTYWYSAVLKCDEDKVVGDDFRQQVAVETRKPMVPLARACVSEKPENHNKSANQKKTYQQCQWGEYMDFFWPFVAFATTLSNVFREITPSQPQEMQNVPAVRENQNENEDEDTYSGSFVLGLPQQDISNSRHKRPLTGKPLTLVTSVNKVKREYSAVEHLFLGYAKTVGTFSPYRQAMTKIKIAEIMQQNGTAEPPADIILRRWSISLRPISALPFLNFLHVYSRPCYKQEEQFSSNLPSLTLTPEAVTSAESLVTSTVGGTQASSLMAAMPAVSKTNVATVIPPTTIVCLPPAVTTAVGHCCVPSSMTKTAAVASSSAVPYLALTSTTPIRALSAQLPKSQTKPKATRDSSQVTPGSSGRNSRSSNKPPPGAVNLERSYQICQAVIQNSPNRDQLRFQLLPPSMLTASSNGNSALGGTGVTSKKPDCCLPQRATAQTQYGVVTSSHGGVGGKPFTPPLPAPGNFPPGCAGLNNGLGAVPVQGKVSSSRTGLYQQRQPSPPVVVRHVFTSSQGIPVTMAVLPPSQVPPAPEVHSHACACFLHE
ncbi:hypothetical protein PR048_023115 [Dryococelus australis]|uniref:Uncharacterized protein n=1 Tax=Dryococelus australis TaxID=614101 RepID=A0ABQ9GT79_9NEOP|nr:hypothetical protein PR048_023115 [Dryococelus australis]